MQKKIEPFPEASRKLLRNTLLDAARELATAESWGSVSMAAVATRASVSRQTLYNEFGNKQRLAEALVLHIVEEILSAIESELARLNTDPTEALTKVLERFLEIAHTDALIRAVTSEGNRRELLPLITADAKILLTYAAQRLARAIRTNWSFVSIPDAHDFSDHLVRLCLIYVVLPGKSPQDAAAMVVRVLAPYIKEKFAEIPTA